MCSGFLHDVLIIIDICFIYVLEIYYLVYTQEFFSRPSNPLEYARL